MLGSTINGYAKGEGALDVSNANRLQLRNRWERMSRDLDAGEPVLGAAASAASKL